MVSESRVGPSGLVAGLTACEAALDGEAALFLALGFGGVWVSFLVLVVGLSLVWVGVVWGAPVFLEEAFGEFVPFANVFFSFEFGALLWCQVCVLLLEPLYLSTPLVPVGGRGVQPLSFL